MAIRIVNIALMFLFLLAMGIQFNDPDPAFWVAIYGCVAVISALAAFSKLYIPLIVVAFAVCLGGSLYLMPSVFEVFLHHDASDLMAGMSPDRPYIEEARESLGLLVAAAALAYFFVLAMRVRRNAGNAAAERDGNAG